MARAQGNYYLSTYSIQYNILILLVLQLKCQVKKEKQLDHEKLQEGMSRSLQQMVRMGISRILSET